MTHTNRIAARPLPNATPIRKVVVVNDGSDALGMLDAVLDAGRYEMVLVESNDHAYSQVKKELPNLVIFCPRVGNIEEFQLLTMLKLDPETRGIPVLADTTEWEGQDFDAAVSQMAEKSEGLLPSRFWSRMN